MTFHDLTFIQVGVGEAASQLLDDVDGLQVSRAFQPHDGVDGELGKVIFVVSEQLGGQCGAGDVQQVLLETSWVVAMETREDDEAGKVEGENKETNTDILILPHLWLTAASLRASLAA